MLRTQGIRRLMLICLAIAIVVATGLLLGTSDGRAMIHDPKAIGPHVRTWVAMHSILSPILLLLAFVILSILALPIWWLQVLAGYSLGLVMGIACCEISAAVAAVLTAGLSRFLFGEWFHTRVESHAARVRRLDEKFGHNGLLVVCAVRLAHILPAGLSNYVLGLSTISLIDIAMGTLIGSLPTITIYATLGADPHLLRDWHFIATIAGINIILLIPLALRYLRPRWFRQVGIE